MSYTQHWTVEGLSYTPESILSSRTFEVVHAPYSIAYFCPESGNVWATRVVMDDFGRLVKWSVLQVLGRHTVARPTFGPRGSILEPWATEVEMLGLPLELLEREFHLHFADHILRGNSMGLTTSPDVGIIHIYNTTWESP